MCYIVVSEGCDYSMSIKAGLGVARLYSVDQILNSDSKDYLCCMILFIAS